MSSISDKAVQSGTLAEYLRRFAHQQHMLYGDIIITSHGASLGSEPSVPIGSIDELAVEQETPLLARLAQVREPWVAAQTMDALNQLICNCHKCPLGDTRTHFVFGSGNPNADIVVIGEAPGADEDASGEPFMGRSGQLLTKILAAVGFERKDVFICNIIKCRPPGNRTPHSAEVEQCEPYLIKQLELAKPRFILALGLTAACTLLNRKAKMSELRGSVHNYNGIKVIVTYHPAALLRNAQWKRPTWEDVQLLRQLYDEERNAE